MSAAEDFAGLPPLNVPALLQRFGLHPTKRLGQNFLTDEGAIRRILEAAGLTHQETVLEIGPGLGSLTRHLAMRARQVVAVELDAALWPALQHVLSQFPNVRLIQGDILALDPARLAAGDDAESEPAETLEYLVVANIPYYITSALVRHLLEASQQPRRLVLTVQREVAERICAAPGELSLLGLSVQVYGRPRIAARIPAGAFYPSPKVDSAVVRVDTHPAPLFNPIELKRFFRLARAGFSQKRKTLRNALAGGMHWTPAQAETILLAAGIEPRRRAETLSLEEWRRLVKAVPG